MKQKVVNVGLIGCGTIGTGVAHYLESPQAKQFNIVLKKIAVKNLKRPRKHIRTPLTTNVNEILNDPQIDIVVELIGGLTPAKEYLLTAIKKGKSVVTANKAVMARFSKELFAAARKSGVDIGFEASVGGGIQILSTLNRLKGEKIIKLMGVLNGTTNYILTKMEDGLDFNTALKEAQAAGFAEANHILDTGGFDSRDKLAFLASLIFNTHINPEKITCRGITDITPVDFNFASSYGVADGGRGYAIRLLAVAMQVNGSIELRVSPAMISRDHPLASVRNEFNAIFIDSELTGEQMLYGKGAGSRPTASAVKSDILHIAENIRRGVIDELPRLNTSVKLLDAGRISQKGYVRVNLKHIPGSLAKVAGILAKHGLNIEDSFQRKRFEYRQRGQQIMPDIITFVPAQQKVIQKALIDIKKSDRTTGSPFFLSIEE